MRDKGITERDEGTRGSQREMRGQGMREHEGQGDHRER